jgi:dienelactone hydrolase
LVSLFHRLQAAAVLAACCALTPASADNFLPPLDSQLHEQVIMVPAGPGLQSQLETTVFRPDGPGPFPLLVINHGKNPGDPSLQQRDRFVYMAAAFVRRGYAVMVPMRSGFAHSTGQYADFGCDMTSNGYGQANDVIDTIRYARKQSWIDGERIIVAGQSYGGLATMALAAQDVPGVRGVLNFAGGLKIDDGNCNWQASLVRAFENFGASSKVPSLWMYGANDSYFGPDLANKLYRAYTGSGGHARLMAFGAFKRDAHVMLASRDGEKVWLPETERFLQQIGMPTAEMYAYTPPAQPPKTDFAAIENVSAIPFLSEQGRAAYKSFLARMTPRAFAVAPNGSWGWAEDGEDPDGRALAACQGKSREPCRLYTVDDYVVWQDGPEKDTAVGRTE